MHLLPSRKQFKRTIPHYVQSSQRFASLVLERCRRRSTEKKCFWKRYNSKRNSFSLRTSFKVFTSTCRHWLRALWRQWIETSTGSSSRRILCEWVVEWFCFILCVLFTHERKNFFRVILFRIYFEILLRFSFVLFQDVLFGRCLREAVRFKEEPQAATTSSSVAEESEAFSPAHTVPFVLYKLKMTMYGERRPLFSGRKCSLILKRRFALFQALLQPPWTSTWWVCVTRRMDFTSVDWATQRILSMVCNTKRSTSQKCFCPRRESSHAHKTSHRASKACLRAEIRLQRKWRAGLFIGSGRRWLRKAVVIEKSSRSALRLQVRENLKWTQ